MAAITYKGESLIATKQAKGEVMNIDRVILANIPGLDPGKPVDRNEQLPPAEYIVLDEPVSQHGYINPNLVVYSLHMGTGGDPFDFNWMGLQCSEDDTVVVINYMPTQGKDPTQAMTRNLMVEYSGAQETGDIHVPAESWMVDFSQRMDGTDGRSRQMTQDVFGRQLFYGDACKVVKGSGGYYDLLPGEGYVAGIRFDYPGKSVLVSDTPTSIWLDVSQQGNAMSDILPIVEVLVSDEEQNDYIDDNGVPHYMEKITLVQNNNVIDKRYYSKNSLALRPDQLEPITHITLAEAIADNNQYRQTVRILERGGAEFRRALSQSEYSQFPTSAKFTDAAGIQWILKTGCFVTPENLGAALDGVTNDYSILADSVKLGVPVKLNADKVMRIIADTPISMPEGSLVYADIGSGAQLLISGTADSLFLVDKPRVFFSGIVADTPIQDGFNALIKRTYTLSDDWVIYKELRVSRMRSIVVLDAHGSAGSLIFDRFRSNQVRKPIVNIQGGVNVIVSNSYMLGVDIGVDIGGDINQPEGWIVKDSIILPNRVGAIGVRITAGLSIQVSDNVIDQVGSGGTAIYIDGSKRKIEDITTSNVFLGSASTGAEYGIRARGDVRNLNILDQSINQFNRGIELETLSPSKTILFPYIAPRHIRPGSAANLPDQLDINLIGAKNVTYGQFFSQSKQAIREDLDTTIALDEGFFAEGSIKRALMAAPTPTQIAFIGTSKSAGTPVVGTGMVTTSTNARIFVPLNHSARRSANSVDISNIDHFSLRTPSGSIPVTDIKMNSSTDTGITLEVTVSGQTIGQTCLLQFADSAGWISLR